MSVSLYELVRREVNRMVSGFERHEKGNIHPLIMHQVEKYIIGVVLEETRFNLVLAAKILGISRSTLYRKIQTFKIPDQPK